MTPPPGKFWKKRYDFVHSRVKFRLVFETFSKYLLDRYTLIYGGVKGL